MASSRDSVNEMVIEVPLMIFFSVCVYFCLRAILLCVRALADDEDEEEEIPSPPTSVYSGGGGGGGGGGGEGEGDDCAVCLDEFEEKEHVKVLPGCKHVFHATCIRNWLRYKQTCPLCRVVVRPQPSRCADDALQEILVR